ncbi:MAG TPA: outer membrane protein [Methylocystis sp.]|nr:outer membrane protein [Methylocystis sp.]
MNRSASMTRLSLSCLIAVAAYGAAAAEESPPSAAPSAAPFVAQPAPKYLSFPSPAAAPAAELPPTAAPRLAPFVAQPAPRYFTWTGGYAGFQLGGLWQKQSDVANGPLIALAGFPNLPGYVQIDGSATSVIAGGHIGYNQQFEKLVLGVEADLEGTNATYTDFTYGLGFGPYTVKNYNSVRASTRARVGYAIDHVLLYATGGAAFSAFQSEHNFLFAGNLDQSSFNPIGWTVGGGVEYAFMGGLSARLEYRYTDFGSTTITSAAPGLIYRFGASDHALRAGISYRFWAPPPPTYAPIVSKY